MSALEFDNVSFGYDQQPVVTDVKKATNALFWAVREMEHRYELLSEMKTRHIDQYNRKIEKLEMVKISKFFQNVVANSDIDISIAGHFFRQGRGLDTLSGSPVRSCCRSCRSSGFSRGCRF